MISFPFLVERPVFMPIGTFDRGPRWRIGRRTICKRENPILNEVAPGVRLNIDRDILVQRRLRAFGFEIVLFPTVGTCERFRTSGSGFIFLWGYQYLGGHMLLSVAFRCLCYSPALNSSI